MVLTFLSGCSAGKVTQKDVDLNEIHNKVKEELGEDYYPNREIEIDTSVKNGQTIVIIKDSFANSFIPFLVNHYEKIIVIDTRYFGANIVNFIEEKEVDEILFLFNIQNFSQEKTLSMLGR